MNPAIAARLASLEALLGLNRDQAGLEIEAERLREEILAEASRHVIQRVDAIRTPAEVAEIEAQLAEAMARAARR